MSSVFFVLHKEYSIRDEKGRLRLIGFKKIYSREAAEDSLNSIPGTQAKNYFILEVKCK